MSVVGRLVGRADRSAVVIESLRRRDLGAVMRIEIESYPRPWTEGIFREELEMMGRGERCYLAARRGGRLLGYAGMMYALDEAHVTNVAVAPTIRRSGVATLLLGSIIRDARRRGCPAVTLEVRSSNAAARELYRRFGFVDVGSRKDYYGSSEDAIVMWLHGLQGHDCAERLSRLCGQETQ